MDTWEEQQEEVELVDLVEATFVDSAVVVAVAVVKVQATAA